MREICFRSHSLLHAQATSATSSPSPRPSSNSQLIEFPSHLTVAAEYRIKYAVREARKKGTIDPTFPRELTTRCRMLVGYFGPMEALYEYWMNFAIPVGLPSFNIEEGVVCLLPPFVANLTTLTSEKPLSLGADCAQRNRYDRRTPSQPWNLATVGKLNQAWRRTWKNSGNTTLRESGVSCGWQSCWKGKWRSKTWNRSSCRNVCVSDAGCMVDGERDVARAVSLTPISGVTKPTTFPCLTCPHEHTHRYFL